MADIVNSLKSGGVAFFKAAYDSVIQLACLGAYKESRRRNGKRGWNSLQWFTQEEATTAEALLKIIIPSEEDSPGIEDVAVLGPSAITLLDKLVQSSPFKQDLYSLGLLSFDIWAVKQFGSKFADLPTNQQVILFRMAQEIYDNRERLDSPIKKGAGKLLSVAQARAGKLHASQLYPMIRADAFQIFYTSRVSWAWLEYDGPPMEKGYPSVLKPRSP